MEASEVIDMGKDLQWSSNAVDLESDVEGSDDEDIRLPKCVQSAQLRTDRGCAHVCDVCTTNDRTTVQLSDVTVKYSAYTDLQHKRERYSQRKLADVDVSPSPFLQKKLGAAASTGRLPGIGKSRARKSPSKRRQKKTLGGVPPPSPLAIPEGRGGFSSGVGVTPGSRLSPQERKDARERLVLPRVNPEAAMLAQRSKLRSVLFPERHSPDLDVTRMSQLGRINNIIAGNMEARGTSLTQLRSRLGGGVGSWIVKQCGEMTSTMDVLRYTPMRRRKGSAAFEVRSRNIQAHCTAAQSRTVLAVLTTRIVFCRCSSRSDLRPRCELTCHRADPQLSALRRTAGLQLPPGTAAAHGVRRLWQMKRRG